MLSTHPQVHRDTSLHPRTCRNRTDVDSRQIGGKRDDTASSTVNQHLDVGGLSNGVLSTGNRLDLSSGSLECLSRPRELLSWSSG
jgi:hypothetical protein